MKSQNQREALIAAGGKNFKLSDVHNASASLRQAQSSSKLGSSNVAIIEAREQDYDSLTTILPRAFHPVNPYIKRTIPDGPNMRAWWRRIIESQSSAANCHVLAAIDTTSDKGIGMLLLRRMGPDERGAGFWTSFEPAQEIDLGPFYNMINGMVEFREKTMMGRTHYLLEFFGVDHEWKGKGVGLQLLARACEISDGSGDDIYVQANAGARSFYEKLGFTCESTVVMPGDEGYTECMMIRRCRQ